MSRRIAFIAAALTGLAAVQAAYGNDSSAGAFASQA